MIRIVIWIVIWSSGGHTCEEENENTSVNWSARRSCFQNAWTCTFFWVANETWNETMMMMKMMKNTRSMTSSWSAGICHHNPASSLFRGPMGSENGRRSVSPAPSETPPP